MNARQTKLYNLLIDNGDKWIKQEQIAYLMANDYDYSFSLDIFDTFHNSATRLDIMKDIRAINNDDAAEKIIISSPRGVKIATEEECLYYIGKEYASVFRKLSRVRKKEKKARLNHQISINGKTIEAFLEEYFNG